MPTLLQIDSSPRAASISNKLTAAFAAEWQKQNPTGIVFHHNTTLENIPYVDEPTIGAFYTPAEALTPEQKEKIVLSNQLVDEFLAADVVILGVPMWNLGIPASLKAWFDLIVRAGRTFAYTANGVSPLVPAGKKVYVFSARGGSYATGTPYQPYDQQEPYLRTIFGFLGLTDVQFVYADNQGRSAEVAAEGLAKAEADLAALAA